MREIRTLRSMSGKRKRSASFNTKPKPPRLFSTLPQDFIARVRMAADPVDILIAPRVSEIGLLDFHRGAEAIDAGRRAVDVHAGDLLELRKTFPACSD